MFFQLDKTYDDTSGYDHSDVVCTSQASDGYLCDYVTVFKAEEFKEADLNQAVVEEKIKEEIGSTDVVRYKLLLTFVYSIFYFIMIWYFFKILYIV